jgi:3-hydroxybutyryl-CoA dehydrogenase
VSEGALVGVLGAGRIGRQIALAFALGGCRVRLVDAKDGRPAAGAERALADARREIERDLGLMVEERVVDPSESTAVRGRIQWRVGLDALADCEFVEEALPESVPLKRAVLARLGALLGPEAIVASGSSTISPSHLADALSGPERFLVAHWLNPAHIIPLVDVVPGPLTSSATVQRGFIGPRLQVLLMNEAVRLVEEGVATPEDVDRAFKAGMGFRYASIGIFEFIDWGGVDILYHASRYLSETLADARFKPARLVEEKMARNELGPKTGRGFFDYAGDRRQAFETDKVRALLRRLRLERS